MFLRRHTRTQKSSILAAAASYTFPHDHGSEKTSILAA
jgi:hypothetical protein